MSAEKASDSAFRDFTYVDRANISLNIEQRGT